MRHKIYPLIISLVFLFGMIGLQGCFEDHYSNPGYGYGGYGVSPAYSYAPPYRSNNYNGPGHNNGSQYYRPRYNNAYRAGERQEEHEEHEAHAEHQGSEHQSEVNHH